MSKVLIIHPSDRTTHFLDIVYNPIVKEKTIITQGDYTTDELIGLIESHEQVMMMGHGTPHGLMSVGRFPKRRSGYVIDSSMVEALSKKDNSVYIWCNADQFVNRYKLKGFYTGMFISEVGEARYCGVGNVPQSVVDESNYKFCNILATVINEDKKIIHETVLEQYGELVETNGVAKYNHVRLYLNE